MPRIRTVKPEFWSSPGIENISPWSRLLFIAMWNWADDAGRGTCQLRELQAFAFPYDEEAPEVATPAGFRRTLAEVRDQYGVLFYKVGGRPYYAIPSWKKHQRNERTAKSKYPAPEEGEVWDFLPPDQGSSGTSDILRRTVAEAETGPSEDVADPHTAPEDQNTPDPGASGVIPLFGTPNTPPDLGSSGTSDNVRHGAAEAPQTSGPGTGEQGNRGTGELSSSRKQTVDVTRADDPALSPLNRGREDALRICLHLKARVVENGSKPPRVSDEWMSNARLMLDTDRRTEAEVHHVIDWCQADPFWKANVLSLPTLRKQYDRLRLKAQQPQAQPLSGAAAPIPTHEQWASGEVEFRL